MTYEEQRQRIAQLSEESKTATPARYEAIKEEIAALKEPCYECGTKKRVPEHFPFCGEACHQAYAEHEYEQPKIRRRGPTVEQMQQRLRKMGQAAAQRVIREGVGK